MLTTRRKQIRSLHSWAISVLLEEGVIRQCHDHGWMKETPDPHARERVLDLARFDPPAGYYADQAVAEMLDLLESIGDECPECPPSA